MGLGVHLLAGILSGPAAFQVQAFHCPAYCPFCFASGNVGLAIKYGADVVTVIGGNVSINGEPYAGDLFEVASGFTVSRGPRSSLKWKRVGISRVARVHLDLGNQHIFLDSQEYKTPHMPTANLQNVRLQASGNLALSYRDSIITGLCARKTESESDPLPRSEYLFSDEEVYALESTCGMLAGGAAEASYQTAPATPAEACAMSGVSIDEATVACANLAVDRAAHVNCMFDYCAMGGDETAVTAGIGAIMDNSDAAVVSENATAKEMAQSIFSAFSDADDGLMTFNTTSCPAGTEPIRPLPIILTAEELLSGLPTCRLCDVGSYESGSVCQSCPDGSTTFAAGASVCTFLQPPAPPPHPPLSPGQAMLYSVSLDAYFSVDAASFDAAHYRTLLLAWLGEAISSPSALTISTTGTSTSATSGTGISQFALLIAGATIAASTRAEAQAIEARLSTFCESLGSDHVFALTVVGCSPAQLPSTVADAPQFPPPTPPLEESGSLLTEGAQENAQVIIIVLVVVIVFFCCCLLILGIIWRRRRKQKMTEVQIDEEGDDLENSEKAKKGRVSFRRATSTAP